MIRRTACLIAREMDPCRNQAIEKHLMDTLPEETAILFLWNGRPSVSLGRCQNARYACDAERFTQSGGTVLRRLSGGGAIYQDAGCVNATILLPKAEWDASRQLGLIGMTVGAFGLQAQPHGVYDLAVQGSRFCANAFLKSGAAAMHQCTLLVKAGLGALRQALEVEEGKLPQHFRTPPVQRGNLSDWSADITPESLREALYWAFARVYGAQPSMLDERMLDEASIARLAQAYAAREWVLPQSVPYTFSVAERFPWGNVEVQLLAEEGVIRAARVYTDAMEAGLFLEMERALIGTPFLISAIASRFGQRMGWMAAPRLRQLTGDVCTLICGRIRAMDRPDG